MRIDKNYLNELTRPFDTDHCLTISEYIKKLDANNIPYEESEGKLSEKFIFHVDHLIFYGRLIGPARERSGASQLGLKIGANRNAIVVNDGLVKYIKPSKIGIVKPMTIWLRDQILGVIISSVALAMILAYLNL